MGQAQLVQALGLGGKLGRPWLVAREEASRECGLGDGSTRGRQRALILCSFPTEAATEHGDVEDGTGEGPAKGRWIRATAGGEGRQEVAPIRGGVMAVLGSWTERDT